MKPEELSVLRETISEMQRSNLLRPEFQSLELDQVINIVLQRLEEKKRAEADNIFTMKNEMGAQ